MKQFEAELMFFGLDNAAGAQEELRAAGFTVEITDAIDDLSNAVFVEVSHASELDLWDRVKDIIRPFDGDILEGGVVDVMRIGAIAQREKN